MANVPRLLGRTPSALLRAAAIALCLASAREAAAQGSDPQPPPAAQQPSVPSFEETIEVVGATPIHGLGVPRDRIPSNIQTVTAGALGQTGAISFGEQVNIAVPSVHVNEATANPFQNDLQFRGFVGSPLLGLPQGIAVYQNGVRLNEPFGDTVNWDLVPDNAVAGVNVMPGSNPLFGLNALGGAVSVQTKTGFSHPGHEVSLSAGSFGRYVMQGASGGSRGPLSYFAAGTLLSEDGWRDFSPSRIRQLFGDIEWRRGATSMNATVTVGVNRLTGNGPAPVDLLEEDRTAVFTYPDETDSNMSLLTMRARHVANASMVLDALVYYRRASIDTFNGDDSAYDECDDDALEQFVCDDEGGGEPVENQFGGLVRIDEGDEFDGTNNRSGTLTNGWGGGLQAAIVRPIARRANHFIVGAAVDGGRADYEASTELARLTAQRGTVGSGLFDERARVRVRASVNHAGVYAADFFTVTPRLTVMGAARFNHSAVTLRDRVGTSLNGDHRFSRLNPAVGGTYELTARATAYASFSTSSRVPAPSELSCADPEDPCRLPNAFVADPPLDQVVAHTWEGGVRGRRGGVAWGASVFRTAIGDDIMFVSSGPLTNTGHFQNVGDTRRQGVEVVASAATPAFRWGVGYSFLRATFETPLRLSSPNHPVATAGEIAVVPGRRVPGVPQHNLKANVSAAIGSLTLSGSLLATSNQYLRGDEANLLPALDGFTVVSVGARYALARSVAMTARVANLFDSEHATFGVLGEPDEVLGDRYDDPRFVSPAAPRAAWIGLEIAFR